MKLKGSKTEENLKTALQGEALAHLKYQFYKSQLGKTSKDIEEVLDEIIHNEKEHGKIWFKLLHDGQVPTNEVNLRDAMTGENHEYIEMYPTFARVAEKEGFVEIAKLFDGVAAIEGQHRDKFVSILKSIENKELFESTNKVYWKCKNCGYMHFGIEAPEECPICKHPQKYFVRD